MGPIYFICLSELLLLICIYLLTKYLGDFLMGLYVCLAQIRQGQRKTRPFHIKIASIGI